MRRWRLPLILAMALAAAGGAACWSSRARTTASAPGAGGAGSTGSAAEAPPRTSGIRFASRPSSRCTRVVAHLFERSKSDLASSGLTEAFLEEMQRLAVASCEETAWSAESLDCYESTDTGSEISSCFGAMTPEQQDDFKRRMFELQRQQLGSPSPPPP